MLVLRGSACFKGKCLQFTELTSLFYFRFDPPIEFRPGDEFKVQCFFNSQNMAERTYFGQGTYDEMCFALMT